MRILEFEIQKQRLIKKPTCDFSGLVAGSIGYLQAKFYFSDSEWHRCTDRVARFWLDNEEHAVLLDEHNSCTIPSEVLTGSKFEVSVIGAAPGYKIETNKISVKQGVY